MTKKLSVLAIFAAFAAMVFAETKEDIKFGNFNQWISRSIKESALLGGNTRTIYEIGPTQKYDGAKAYKNMGGSPWATSNAYANVMGIVKVSGSVTPETRSGNDKCVKMSTLYEHVKAIGIINLDVMVSGSIFLGEMFEPIKSSKNPYSKMEMGIKFTKRPKYLQLDYKVYVPENGKKIYSSGFGKKKELPGKDNAEVYIILQRRWEDEKGNIHAARVGTGRERYDTSTNGWINNHRIEVHYGDITKKSFYKSWMGLINGDKCYYARNSKGKLVKVQEDQWDSADATPTHMLVMASSGCGTAYEGTEGMVLWVDNISLIY